LALGVFFYFAIKNILQEESKIDLLHNIISLSTQIKSLEEVDDKVKQLHNLLGFRITIIDKTGVVLAESDKDKKALENHIDRDEIIAAKYNDYGSSIRYSATLKKDFLYVAKKFSVGKEYYYIRMARDLEHINKEFLSIGYQVGVIFLIFGIFGLFASFRLGKDIELETKEIIDFLKNLVKQKREEKINSNHSIEFNKITNLLSNVSETLSKRNKQKAKYTAKLKLSNRQKDEIISAISHEFKNPIAVISGYTQTLITDKDINQKIRDKFLEKIATNAEKMSSMIDRLRLSIRLDDGQTTLNLKNTNLKTIILRQIDDLKSAYPSRDIVFSGDELDKEVDETLISIAIINLIENALKYSQDRVTVNLTDKELSVVDSGIGINQKEIENITKKFYRVSTNGWNNSLGVGLSLVVNILNGHNFKLEITSVENEGSTFKIVF